MQFEVRTNLKETYDSYYGSERMTQWRRLGAIDKAANITRLCSHENHSTIIDVGCGDGAVLERLDELSFGESFFAVDVSRSGVEELRGKPLERLVESHVFDGYNLPYTSNRFDLAILSHVIEHVEYPRRLLREAGRVASRVYVEVPLEHTLRMRRDYHYDSVGHINFYTDKTIRRLLQTVDYEIVGQDLADDSLAVLQFGHGRLWGSFRHIARHLGLKAIPEIAKHVFVYNGCILARTDHLG